MSYRVETAASGRAVCVATDCKKNKIKIDKGELRLGVWVEIEERGSYKWKHWGCVTGMQLQNMRERLADPQNPGSYQWDMLDGYDGDDKNSLEHHPDLQEKVRRVITQGFIDPEDFNGDPEMNKLGEKGLRTPASKKKKRDDDKKRAEEANSEEKEDSPTPAKAASKKRVKGEDDEDVEEKKPAKKKRATKAKKEEDDDEGSKPIKKSRARKVKKEEDEEMDDEESKPAPVKKSRAKKAKKEEDADIVKDEEDQEASAITAPKKKPAARKKAVKEEEADESNDVGEPSEPKVKAKRGRKKAVKEEPSEDTTMTTGVESSAVAEGSTLPTEFDSSAGVKGEPSDAVDVASAAPSVDDIDAQIAILKGLDFSDVSLPADASATEESVIPGIKDFDLQNMVAEGVASGEIDDTSLVAFLQTKRDEVIAELEKTKKKGGRGKKAAPAKSGRGSRSRTASKN